MGRERQWDIELRNGSTTIPLIVLRRDGVPVWQEQNVPAIAGQSVEIAEDERTHVSWQSGFGYGQFLVPNTYHYADAMDAHLPRTIIMGPLKYSVTGALGTVTQFFEHGTVMYAVCGRYVQRVSTASDTCVTPNSGADGQDLGASAVATMAIPFDGSTGGQTIVLIGNSAKAWTLTTATWAQCSNNVYGSYGCKFWSDLASDYVLAKSELDSSDPTVTWIARGGTLDTTPWSASYDVGDDARAITGMAGGEKMAWVAKTDGLYYVEGGTGRSVRVLPAIPIASTNGANLFVDSAGRVWYPSAGGLYRYDPSNGTVADVTPGRGLPNGSPIFGRVTDITQYRDWFYCSMYNGTDSYVVMGRDRENGEPGYGPMIWHGALFKVAGASIGALYILGSTTPPRLYYGAGTTVGYIKLPTHGDNPLLDTLATYAASGSIYFPADYISTTGVRSALAGFVIDNEGLNTATYADLYVQLDASGWQRVGTINAPNRAFLAVPSGDWRFSTCAFRLDVTNSSSTTTPKIRAIAHRATRRIATVPLIQTTVVCSERVLSHYGIKSRSGALSLADAIDALALEGPIELGEWWGGAARSTPRKVMVMPSVRRIAAHREKAITDEEALVVDISMKAVTSASTPASPAPSHTLWGAFQWGGSPWG